MVTPDSVQLAVEADLTIAISKIQDAISVGQAASASLHSKGLLEVQAHLDVVVNQMSAALEILQVDYTIIDQAVNA